MEDPGKLSTTLISKQNSEENKNFADVTVSSQVTRVDIPMRNKLDFEFLDEFIRFDVTRTGVYCCSGYEISVQYDDYFIKGKSGSLCCGILSSSNTISLKHDNEVFLHIDFLSTMIRCRATNRRFVIKLPDEDKCLGMVRMRKIGKSLLQVENQIEKCCFTTEKVEHNLYSVSCENGTQVATIAIYRGFRGGISTYGLTLIADTSPLNKALLIALTLAMDIKEREAEMSCCFCYIPLIAIVIISMFVFLPLMFISD